MFHLRLEHVFSTMLFLFSLYLVSCFIKEERCSLCFSYIPAEFVNLELLSIVHATLEKYRSLYASGFLLHINGFLCL